MTIGKRISTLRKNLNYSQEYVAQQLDVSRQAVSKWETDLSSPDTNNLIQLAKLLNTTVEYIACGKESNFETDQKKKEKRKLSKKQKSKILITGVLAIILLTVLGVTSFIATRPVKWDSGACGSGFETYIFDKYSEELTEKFLSGSEISNIKAVKGSQNAEWNGRKIYLEFDVRYEDQNSGTVTQRLRFIGKRYWIERYNWGGAIIMGE